MPPDTSIRVGPGRERGKREANIGVVARDAQDVGAQERRLVDIHALLLDLPAVDAPGARRKGSPSRSFPRRRFR